MNVIAVVETIIKKLVDFPESVRVTSRVVTADGIEKKVFQVHVAPKDLGRVIGTEGRIVKALRSFVDVIDHEKHDLVVDSAE